MMTEYTLLGKYHGLLLLIVFNNKFNIFALETLQEDT